MPHCIIDYSRDIAGQIEIETLLDAVHLGAMDSALFPEYDLKTRALGYQHHRTGQTRDSFVHVSLHLLSGRSDQQKSMLSECVLARIESLLPPGSQRQCRNPRHSPRELPQASTRLTANLI